MDPVSLVEVALTAGATAGVKDTASSAVKDAYEGLKAKLKSRLTGRPAAEQALAEDDTVPQIGKGPLTSELAAAGIDAEIVIAAQELMRLIDAEGTQAGKYEVDARDEPSHPLGVNISARNMRNEASGTIGAYGLGSYVNLVVDDLVNAGNVIADQSGSGTRLTDHLRVIAGHISDDVTKWDKGTVGNREDGAFALQYVRYGPGRQAGELYDSAVRNGLVTSMARAEFERAATPAVALRVANELIRWADDLDRRFS